MGRLGKLYMGTNTKMYKTNQETLDYLDRLRDLTEDIGRERLELFVIPSYTALSDARKVITDPEIRLGAQNMCWEQEGQFTGEISPRMLSEIGVRFVMVGHSERRHIFGEQDSEENRKVICALENGFQVLLCVGETQEEKDAEISDEVLCRQVKRGLRGVDRQMALRLWVAYEPVWAIGENGIPASSAYADNRHQLIRTCLVDLFGEDVGGEVPILYGGSVNQNNAAELIQQESIDGLFIGRSAWEAENFNKIIRKVIPLFEQKRGMERGL